MAEPTGISNTDNVRFRPEGDQPRSPIGVVPQAEDKYTYSPQMQTTMGQAVTYGLPALGVGFFDTVGQSVGLFGADTVANTMKAITPGAGGFGDFYQRNKTPIQAGADILGMFIPGYVGIKVLHGIQWARNAGKLGTILKDSASLDFLLGNASALSASETAVKTAATSSAEDFGIIAGRAFNNPALDTAKKAYYSARLASTVREFAAFEAGSRAFFNASDTLYPAESTLFDELKWSGIGLGAAVGVDAVIGRFAVRSLLKAAGAAADYGGLLGEKAGDIVSRPGQRGVAAAYFSRTWQLANSAIEQAASPVLKANAKQDMAVFDKDLKTTIIATGQDTHPVLPRTTFSTDQLDLVANASKANENLLAFATKTAQLPKEGQASFYQDLSKAITNARGDVEEQQNLLRFGVAGKENLTAEGRGKLRKVVGTGEILTASPKELAAAQTKLDALQNANDEWHLVLEGTGDLTNYRTRAWNYLDDKDFDSFKRSTFKVKEDVSGALKDNPHLLLEAPEHGVKLDDRFIYQGPADPSAKQWSALYAMGSRMVANFKPAEGQRLVLNEKVPYFQADAILNLAQVDKEAAKSVRLDGKFQSMADAEFAVVDQKYQGFIKDMARTESLDPAAPAIIGRRLTLTPAEIFQKYNMPVGDGLKPHPLAHVFMAAKLQGSESLRDMLVRESAFSAQAQHPMELLQAAMREAAEETDPTVTYATSGKMFQQKDIRPVLIASKSVPSLSHNDAHIIARVDALQTLTLARLEQVDPVAAPLLSLVTQELGNAAAVPVAKNVRSLHEGVAAGRGILTPQDRIGDQLETIKALTLVAQKSDKTILSYVGDLFKAQLTPSITFLRKNGNYAHLMDFNRIEQSYRHGWDIKAVVPKGDGTAQFLLDDKSPINNKLMQQYFGRDLEADKANFMPDMSVSARKQGEPIPFRSSAQAADAASQISELSRQSGQEVNALRVANGQAPITIRKFHLPTPEWASDDAWFVRNAQGKVVNTFYRGTAAQNRQRALEASDVLTKLGENHTADALETVKLDHTFDDVFFNLGDYSDQLAKTGVGIKGGLASTQIDTGTATLENMVRSLAQQYVNVGVRGRATIFKPQLDYARSASEMFGSNAFDENNIWQRYMATIFSRSTQSTRGKSFGAGYAWAEGYLDKALSFVYAKKAELTAQTVDGIAASKSLGKLIGGTLAESQVAQYNKIAAKWSPFETTMDWLESTHPEIPTKTLRQVSAGLSKTSATMSLRFLDAGTAILNFAGLWATSPAVMRGMRRLSNESPEQWQGRTASWGSAVSFAPNAKPFSGMKATMQGIHAFWSGELNEPLARAASLGYFKPEYAALASALTTPLRGDASKFSRFVDFASRLADDSEVMTRKLSWAIGYKFGKDVLKFDDEHNLFIFASNAANEMIGNYNPRNKPGMFQGAVGLPLGAFQTYMSNYYRRMFGYLERKDWSTLATGYATQASLFGATSVPGWSAFNSTMFSNWDGSDNLQNRLDRHLSPGVSELLLHGSLSSIPGIFGRPDLDIAFYPRGSADYTQIPANPTDFSRAPPIQFLANVAQGITRTVQSITGAGGFSLQELEEVGANFATNRGIKNILEIVANKKTDRSGQTVEAATRDAVHIAAALAGQIPSSTRALQDSYNNQQIVERNQEAARAVLNMKTRALMRGNEFGTADFQGIVHEYMRAGGNPAYLGTWLRNNVEASFVPKADAKLVELSKTAKWNEFMTMLTALQRNAPPQTNQASALGSPGR